MKFQLRSVFAFFAASSILACGSFNEASTDDTAVVGGMANLAGGAGPATAGTTNSGTAGATNSGTAGATNSGTAGATNSGTAGATNSGTAGAASNGAGGLANNNASGAPSNGGGGFADPVTGGAAAAGASPIGGAPSTPGGGSPAIPQGDMNRPRVIVSTDLGGTDSDDEQSMVHFLVYADHFDVEGILASPHGAGKRENIIKIIDIYEKDYPNLKTHGNYPTADELRAVTKQGAKDKISKPGYAEPTDASRLIIEAAKREDPRPLWISVWGAIDDVSQALHDAPEITPKLRVYWIAGPNRWNSQDAATYLVENHKDLWIIAAEETYRGFFVGGDMSGDYGAKSFPLAHVKGHGALGDFFMAHRADIKMGDTPGITYILDNFKRNPDDPTKPGWGGAYVPCGGDRPHCWEDNTDPAFAEDDRDGVKTISVHRKAWLDDWSAMMDRAQAPKK